MESPQVKVTLLKAKRNVDTISTAFFNDNFAGKCADTKSSTPLPLPGNHSTDRGYDLKKTMHDYNILHGIIHTHTHTNHHIYKNQNIQYHNISSNFIQISKYYVKKVQYTFHAED